MISGCSKDEILNHYNNIVQSAGVIELTGKLSLEGTKEKGIDDYTGMTRRSAGDGADAGGEKRRLFFFCRRPAECYSIFNSMFPVKSSHSMPI